MYVGILIALTLNSIAEQLRGHPQKTSLKMLNFFTPLPPCPSLSKFRHPPLPLDIQQALKMYAILDLSLL